LTEEAFDVIVIGAGPAGEVAAAAIAERGRTVAIVESGLVGGECAFYACMPSKALLRPSEVLAEARRVPGAAEASSGKLDVVATLARRDEVIHDLRDDVNVPWLRERGIRLIRGHGRLAGERSVSVSDRRYQAGEAVVLAVGSGAAMPELAGLTESRPWTNREATTATTLPASLTVLGGGVVGVELAQAYSQLGVSVTVVEEHSRLVSGEEPFVAGQLATALRERTVELRLGVGARSVAREGSMVVLELADGSRITNEELPVAVGRRPLTDDLGLETVGLRPGATIEVDDALRVPKLPWLYAVGDVNGRALLTHIAKYHARIAADVIDGGDTRLSAWASTPPRVIFTDPQIAAVGLTLAQATERAINAHAYDVPTAATPGASFHGRGAPGTCRLVIDEDRGVIVGATFSGPDVAEWLHAATIAVVGEIPLERLEHAVAPFPTRSEVWLALLQERRKRMHES
jgi:pyruvate/2-oxoglutarate dehydrogenase complex dihydrolipoamide dehydrogenase (E3) component